MVSAVGTGHRGWSSARAAWSGRRRLLLAEARGKVLELGAGTVVDPSHYPGSVEEVTVVAPTDVEDAAFAEGSFDTVVSILALCRVHDIDAALDRIHRVLRPRGTLLFLEHVRATGWRQPLQQVADPLWRRAAGCHLDRDVPAALRSAGLVVTDIERFRLGWEPLLATSVQGRARPATTAAAAAPAAHG